MVVRCQTLLAEHTFPSQVVRRLAAGCRLHMQVWCGHEYTIKNLEFAADADKENKAVQEKLQWAKSRRAANQPTIPSTIGVNFTSCHSAFSI